MESDSPRNSNEQLPSSGKKRLSLAFVLLSGAVAVVVLMTIQLIREDSERLVNRFQTEREAQIQDVLRFVEENLHDVTADLKFLSRLMVQASDQEREAFLQALLGGVGAYRAGAIVGADGFARQVIVDPRSGELPDRDEIRSMEFAGEQALYEGTSVAPRSEGQDPWLRAFAQRTENGEAVVLLVDTQVFLDELRFLASDPHSLVLVLGPHGHPAPSTSSHFLSQMEDPSSEIKGIINRMREGDHGTIRIPASEAGWLGFEHGDVVVAFGSVEVRDGVFWSIASFSSLSAIRSAERSLRNRLVGFASVMVLLLLTFGGFVFVVARRTAVLRERLQNAAQLSLLHEKAHKVVQSIPIAVGILDRDLVVRDRNATFEAILGGHGVNDDANSAELLTLIKTAARTRVAQSGILESSEFLGKDGVFQVHVVPIEPSLDDADLILVVEDLSSVRKLEEQLLRVEKLATVGVLAAGIAHEIGTPLGVVRGRAELIQRKLEPESSHMRGLSVIIEQIDRISRTIQELLDFSRLRETRVDPISFADTVRQVLELLTYEIGESIVVDVLVPDGLPNLAANPDQLQQVLVNLILNSVDALSESEKGRIEVGARIETDSLLFWVEDNGVGIPAADRNQVFDPFYTTKKRGQGTGLGLSIVSQIARNHGAKLRLAECLVGTRVEVNWPLSEQEK